MVDNGGDKQKRDIHQCILEGYRQPHLNMQISKMEAHYLAGGDLDRVITALITARGANIQLDFPEACAIDLAGRDVLQAVQ